LLQQYATFIKEELLVKLNPLVKDSEIWWTFKPDSTLKPFLEEEHHHFLPNYFRPQELIDAVKLTFYWMSAEKNTQLIICNDAWQSIFHKEIIYEPDLEAHLLYHVDIVPKDVSISLQNNFIHQNLTINPPLDIIYKDASSRFWLHPVINYSLTKNTRLSFSWKNLLNIFTDFCFDDDLYFKRKDEDFIEINPSTTISSIFNFNCFHVNQIEQILKHLTIYLGKYTALSDICPDLKSEYVFYDFLYNDNSDYNDIFRFIENSVNNLTPPFKPISL
jgi:hypothetical protein